MYEMLLAISIAIKYPLCEGQNLGVREVSIYKAAVYILSEAKLFVIYLPPSFSGVILEWFSLS